LIEEQAWKFAASFLLPMESFSSDLTTISLNGLLALKDRWRISVSAMIMRCADLRIIDDDFKSRLFRNLSMRGWRKQEPLDDQLDVERPRLLRRSIELIVRENVCSASDLLTHTICLGAEDVCQLAGLPPSYFGDAFGANLDVRLKSASGPGETASSSVVDFPARDAKDSGKRNDQGATIHILRRDE
jgi:hypothetical protein